MKLRWRIFVALLLLLGWGGVVAAQQRWFSGNTHTHTTNSDGESSPEEVLRWYRDNQFNFVVITDHDFRSPIVELGATFNEPGKFLVMAGVEVTDRFPVTREGRRVNLPVHVNGIHVNDHVRAQGGETIVDIIRRDARAIRAAGGIPQLNHPNFYWALKAEHILAATEIRHFEVHSGHPLIHSRGGGGSPSAEEIWDHVLSAGRVLYGMATDDSHHFTGEFTRHRANPGRAWIVVRADELTAEAISAAIDRGDFYSTIGVRLSTYESTQQGIRIELPEAPSPNAVRYRTFFIGKDGAVLKRDDSLKPSYDFRGDELYVRARIEASNGTVAWTQPVFLKKPKE